MPVDETHITHQMGDTGIVRLAISLATNKKNKSPVTVPDSRCSITEPLDEHQLCTIISHIRKVCCLAYMPAFFVGSQLYPSRARHIIVWRVRWCAPTPDYRTAGNFTAQLWLLVIPATPAGFNEAVNKLLVVSGGSLYLKVVHLCQIKKLYECLKFGVVNRNNFSVVLLFIPVGSGLIKGMVHTETSRTGG